MGVVRRGAVARVAQARCGWRGRGAGGVGAVARCGWRRRRGAGGAVAQTRRQKGVLLKHAHAVKHGENSHHIICEHQLALFVALKLTALYKLFNRRSVRLVHIIIYIIIVADP